MPTAYENRNAALNRYNQSTGVPPVATPSLVSGAMGEGIAGLNSLSGSAMDVIKNLLSGGANSPSSARRSNAYYGAGSGLGSSNTDPTSDFLARRGFDLYNEQGKKDEQAGIQDLVSLIGGMSGALIPTTGEQQRASEFEREFSYRQGRDVVGDRRADDQVYENQQLNIPWYLRDATHRAQDKWNAPKPGMNYRGY